MLRNLSIFIVMSVVSISAFANIKDDFYKDLNDKNSYLHKHILNNWYGESKFYTYCSQESAAFIIGYSSADCVVFSVDNAKEIKYKEFNRRIYELGVKTGYSKSEWNLSQIKGAKSFDQINGRYLMAKTGLMGMNQNWFIVKLSLSDYLRNSPEADLGLGIEFNLISLGVMTLNNTSNSFIEYFQF